MSEQLLDLDNLRAGLNRVLDSLERERGKVINVPYDYYWHLDIEQAFVMDETPAVNLVGQVSDDLDEMVSALTDDYGDDGFVPVWHDLAHIIGVLRALEHMSRP